ncbi:MAG: serine protease [Ignavibacteriae bacterium]|nr:serine protease [Ignavibacteriota bacterium]NOG98874.1 serine protease [Ignavibacteriota bacterium]
MLSERIDAYKNLEKNRASRLLVYVTSDRQGMETSIANDVLSPFLKHLDLIGDVPKISLYLYTRGGNTLTAWSLVNLIRNFCDELEVIIPFHCHSAGTLISLGANKIIMTKQATLGPIDPSVNGPLNPQIPGAPPHAKVPVSVEFVNAYLEMAKKELKITDQKALSNILIHLSDKIHPLTLGQVYRSNSQIKMLAKRLLKNHKLKTEKEDNIVNFLCSESGSHDYTIHRSEAGKELGLNIEKPDEELYNIIKTIFEDIEQELKLTEPYDPKVILGNSDNVSYEWRRALIETIDGGSHVYKSAGQLIKQSVPSAQGPPQTLIHDNRTLEGWQYEPTS